MYETGTENYFPVECNISGIYQEGKLDFVLVAFHNVTEEQMQHYFLNLVLTSSHVFPWFFNVERSVFVIEAEYFKYLGIPNNRNNELTSEEFANLIHPDDREEMFTAFGRQVAGTLYLDPVQYRLLRGDGVYEWFEGRSTYLGKQASGVPYRVIGICMSIQKAKDKDAEIATVRQSDQLKSAFLANKSHEIRTPLNAIVGFANLLTEMKDFSAEEVNGFIGIINKNCELLLALINDILDLSKIESGTMEFHFSDQSLHTLLKDIYQSQVINMPQGVELCVQKESADKTIRIDLVRLKQVINNLINNAVKFTAQGSITFGYYTNDPGYITFFVQDTGKGISQENQQHIFERFYKIDHFAQGVGLGLAICQTIVAHLNGTISISSELGAGTRFTVKIPEERE